MMMKPTFLLIGIGTFLMHLGYYVPLFYIPDMAVSMGVERTKANFLLSIFGEFNYLLSWLKYTLTKESVDRVYFDHQFTLAVKYTIIDVFLCSLAITNTIGELFCGWISDRSFVNSLTVYNTYVFITGISIFFMPFCYSYIQFVSVISVYGFFSGFDTCESIICVEILGKNLLF